MKNKMDILIYFCLLVVSMVLLCSFNCNGLKNVDNFQNFVSALYEKNISFTMLQETFWDHFIFHLNFVYFCLHLHLV
jgi:hypothetical protein